jgi:outer membrane protein OmpA-like peptidoglycan-associated protein
MSAPRRPLLLVAALAVGVAAACTGPSRPAPPPSSAPPRPASELSSTDLPVSVLESAGVASSELRQVRAILTELGAENTARGVVITLPERVLFDFDKAEIRPDAGPVLAKIAKVLRYYAKAPVKVDGHTDSRGAPEYNQRLSERRAEAVAAALAARGIDPGRLDPSGFGETRPLAPNQRVDGADDPAGRQRNRRVEVVVATGW